MPESVTDRPTKAHEYIFLLANSKAYYYDAAAIAEPARHYCTNETRNARTVWSIPTQAYSGAHYAPMPMALAERCIKAGSRPGDTVLDMFGGSGTTARAAVALGRKAVLIELNPDYLALQDARTAAVQLTMAAA